MKKILYLLLSLIIILTLVGCGSPAVVAPTPAPAPAPAPAMTVQPALTAEGISNGLKANGLPMANIVVLTEETDTNKLLGRPNQYTSKTSFEDTRVTDSKVGGTVEVFANPTDAKTRKDYVERISSSSPMFLQYIYLKGNVLVRIEKELTPSQAAEYEAALSKIVK
jgi:hypothetical protein